MRDRIKIPDDVVAFWWLQDPVQFSCGHVVDLGYPMRHLPSAPPTRYDLVHAHMLGEVARALPQWPCPWCGGEGEVVEALSPDATMAYDPDTDILMRKARVAAKSKGARKHAS